MTASNDKTNFDPKIAFSRNLGWLTEKEQERLSQVTVGLVGLGGVGGQYAEILARLGVERFVICDPDSFSIENTNRQNECKVSNYGRNKAEVIAELIRDINPRAQVTVIPKAMEISQVDDFCRKIDVYIDALDFFVVDLRVAIFRKMHELGKPAVTFAPVGTGAACVAFTKDSMSFDDYFGFHRSGDYIVRSNIFLIGVAPSLQHRHYLQEPGRLDFINRKAPSLPIGVYSCASFAATTLLKLALNRGKVPVAPWSIHYDPYLLKIKKKYIWWGYKNPMQQIKLLVMNKMIKKLMATQAAKGKS